jgi:hypothetical protein
MAGYSSDGYWVADYWFDPFPWWVVFGFGTGNVELRGYRVSFEDRNDVVEYENRVVVVSLEDRTDDVGQS